jgi:DNA polymerase (family 10)
MLDRFGVAAALREIATLLEAEGANPFKVRAYLRGAQALERLRDDLATLVTEERLTRVEGIGPALAATITELVRTGTTGQLGKLRTKLPAGVIELAPLLTVPKIQALQDALGISTLADLEEACRAGRVRTVKGFGPKTEEKLLAAIDALRTKGDSLLLHQATQEAERLLGYLRESSAVIQAEIAGALRRRVEIVDGLELVVASADPLSVAEHVTRFPAVTHVIEQEASTAVVRLAAGVRVEVTLAPAADYATLLLHRTGSPAHLEDLRTHAQAKGYALTETGLTRAGRKLRTRSETDVHAKLGLAPIPPEMREGVGEIEWAAAGGAADALVKVEDIQGMVHCHTVYSDGKNTVEEMARGAEALGMTYLTITDHSPTASYAGGLTLDRLKRQWDEIARVQSKVKVTLLRGTESDINQDGSLDYPDRVLEEMDVIIASVHARHKMDAEAMTKRVIKAMRQPRFKIWGHALGRLLNRRAPFACHMEEILDTIAESRAAVEINGDPHRLDMEPRWIREARRRGIRFVISVDAHSVGALTNLRYGVDMARRGWLTRDEVLNTRPVAAFRKAVRP